MALFERKTEYIQLLAAYSRTIIRVEILKQVWIKCHWKLFTGSSHPSESLRSKMTSNDWTKAQIFTKLVRSDGHLKSATFWLYDCPCEMELSTSFQSKMSKFQCLSHFFQKNQATDLLLFVLVRKGRKVGARIKQQWDSWKCQESWFGLCFCNLKPFAAFWRIPDQCL